MKKFIRIFSLILFCIGIFSIPFLIKKFRSPIHSVEYYHNLTQNKDFPRVDGTILTMELSEDGKTLYVGGDFSQIGDFEDDLVYERNNVAAIKLSDYSITNWAPEVNGRVETMKVYGDYIYIGGSFDEIGDTYTGGFAKLNSDSSLNEYCTPNIHKSSSGDTYVFSIEVNEDYIYVGGSFNRVGTGENEEIVSNLVRLNNNANCTWDSSWDPEPNGWVYDIELDGDFIYIGGDFNEIYDTYTGEFAKLDVDGDLDNTCTPNIYSSGVPSTVHNITLTDEYIYVGGSFDGVGENSVNGLIRLTNSNSCTWDNLWTPEVYHRYGEIVFTISPVGNDVFVGGSFERIGGLSGTEFALLDGDTGDAISYWNPHISSRGSMTVSSSVFDGEKLYIGGNFVKVEGDYSLCGNGNYECPYGLASYTYSYDVIQTIEIETIEDLDAMRDNLMANYKLTKDLDFNDCSSYEDCSNKETYTTGLGWEPIGYYSSRYLGTFDGQGHTVSNIFINAPALEEGVGLFGVVGESGKVQNVGIEGADMTAAYSAGGLVGLLFGKVENSYSKGSVGFESGGECIGGLVGDSVGGVITNSYSEATVTAIYGGGGLVGCNYEGSVINSYSSGAVVDIPMPDYGYHYNGGLIGENDDASVISSFWDKETSGQVNSGGGTGRTTSQMKSILNYEGWDIVSSNDFNPSNPSKWYIEEGNDYPRLSWEYDALEITTKAATDITWSGATLNGELESINDESSVQVYYEYKKSGDVWSISPQSTRTSIGAYSYKLTGLEKNTNYEYRAVVSWRDVGKVYGETLSFTTLATPTIPSTFGSIESNTALIDNKSNTEKDLILTRPGVGSITFFPGLDLIENIDELSSLEENIVVVFEPDHNRYRAFIDSQGASFLATRPAEIRFFNVKKQLGIENLSDSNFKTLLRVTVRNDQGNTVKDTSSYFKWENASYDPLSDILTLPVNHFSEYVLGANTGALPSTGMSSYTLLIPIGLLLMGVYMMVISKRDSKRKQQFELHLIP